MPASSHARLAALAATLDASPKNAEVRLLGILDFVRDPIDDVIDQMGIDNFIAAILALYDTYVAPIDFPWVPNALEPLIIDAPAKQIITAVVRRLHDQIHTD